MITLTHDAREDRLQIYADRVGLTELIGKLTAAMNDRSGGHYHLWDLPPIDPYGEKAIGELVVELIADGAFGTAPHE